MGERNETNRRNPNRSPRRRAPFCRSGQGPGAEIEHSIVGKHLAVTEIKGLVVDKQPDEFAIGHVNESLTRFRSAILTLRFRKRTQLIKTVQIRARQSMRLAFIKIAAHATVT